MRRLTQRVTMALAVVLPAALVAQASVPKEGCGEHLFDGDGILTALASAAAQCPCASAASRRAYKTCVKGVLTAAVETHTLTASCRKKVLKLALRSTCGRPGAVACCVTKAAGTPSCKVKPSPAQCRAPSGGSAVLGSTSDCVQACGPSCGNAIVESGEQCDDGNAVPGDGCSATCQAELQEGSWSGAVLSDSEYEALIVGDSASQALLQVAADLGYDSTPRFATRWESTGGLLHYFAHLRNPADVRDVATIDTDPSRAPSLRSLLYRTGSDGAPQVVVQTGGTVSGGASGAPLLTGVPHAAGSCGNQECVTQRSQFEGCVKQAMENNVECPACYACILACKFDPFCQFGCLLGPCRACLNSGDMCTLNKSCPACNCETGTCRFPGAASICDSTGHSRCGECETCRSSENVCANLLTLQSARSAVVTWSTIGPVCGAFGCNVGAATTVQYATCAGTAAGGCSRNCLTGLFSTAYEFGTCEPEECCGMPECQPETALQCSTDQATGSTQDGLSENGPCGAFPVSAGPSASVWAPPTAEFPAAKQHCCRKARCEELSRPDGADCLFVPGG
jgi:cysteine-rich repeat protein